MADKYANDYATRNQVSGPYSNGFSEVFSVQASAGFPATGEKIYYGKLPAGTLVTDLDFGFEDFGAGNTVSIGFEIEGTPPAGFVVATDALGGTYTTAQATYWFTTRDVSTAAGRAVSTSAPIRFNWPVRLVGTQVGTVVGTPDSYLSVHGATLGAR